MSKQSDFIALVVPGAQQVQREIGMFASVTIAQAAWETGWGTSTPKDIKTGEESYNLFGRKAAAGEPYVESNTWEVYNGKKVYIVAKFKKFDSYVASILDRSEFLKLKWYQRACNADNPWDAAAYLIDTGYPGYAYATDPTYVANLHSIMKSYNLTQYDLPKGVQEEPVKEDEDNMAINAPNWMWKQIYNILGDAYNKGIIEWVWCQKVLDRTLTAGEYTHILAVIDRRSKGINIDGENDAETPPDQRK